MIKKLENMDSELIEKISYIWLNSNLDAHDFIKRDYWVDNFTKVKTILSDSTIYVYYADNQIVGFAGLYEQYIAGIFIIENYRNKGIGRLILERLKKIIMHLIYMYMRKIKELCVFIPNTILK